MNTANSNYNLTPRIAIIGSGALGTAWGKVLADAKIKNLIIYGVDESEVAHLKTGHNPRYFKAGTPLPKFKATTDLAKAVKDADILAFAVPSQVIERVLEQVAPFLKPGVLFVSGLKGYYPGTSLSAHEGIEAFAKKQSHVRGVVSLIGPSFAEEMVQGIPTAIAAVGHDVKLCEEVQHIFRTPYFRVYSQSDVRGATACTAYKNVLAIAAGMVAVMGGGINALAAFLTRGLAEMERFVVAVGGQSRTVMGLSGVGDLILTATSDQSRNFTMGKQIAYNGLAALETKATVEGVVALEYIAKIGRDKHLDLPIVEFLYDMVIKKTKSPADFKTELWKRDLKAE